MKLFLSKCILITFFTLIYWNNNINAQNISTIVGNGTQGYSGDGGPAINAKLKNPEDVCVDDSGNVYIADVGNNRIRKINASTGIINTIAGNGSTGFSGDGGPATNAELYSPRGVCVDKLGNVYIADWNNDRIRKINKLTGIINTIAGGGTGGLGDGGTATSAIINNPYKVCVDDSGNVYFTDWTNKRIRKVTASTGIINTIAGNGAQGYSGDGGAATNAKLNDPDGVSLDVFGDLYIGDTGNQRIRKVTFSTGIINSIAGNGASGYSGDGAAATNANLFYPTGISIDTLCNVYIADWNNNRIRKVSASTGVINTIAGDGVQGYSGDGGAAQSAKLNKPTGVFVDTFGNVYIADNGNNSIRKISSPLTSISANKMFVFDIIFEPNPNSGSFNVSYPYTNGEAVITVSDIAGHKVYNAVSNQNNHQVELHEQAAGIYILQVKTSEGLYSGKIIGQ